MPSTVVMGAQWGDEGKGKIIDILSKDADYIVRYQGGNNAGHTVVIDGSSFIFILFHQAYFIKERYALSGMGL